MHIIAIPAELLDGVIDILASDPSLMLSTLKSCSLVCRSWMHRARFHLFSTLCINISRHDGKALESFVSVVVAITQTAQTFPSAVEMISGLYIYEPSRAWPYNGNPRVLIRTVQALCSLLPNLRSLELMDVMLDSKGSPSQSPVKLFTLDRLVLKLDILEVSSEILTILRLFSQVGSLKIHCHFGTRVKDFPFAPTGSPVSRTLLASADEFTNSVQRGRGLEVAALSLNMDTHGGFYLGLLKKTGLSETVEDLTVYCRTKDDVESLGAFLANDSGCDTLHRLSVDLNLTGSSLFTRPRVYFLITASRLAFVFARIIA